MNELIKQEFTEQVEFIADIVDSYIASKDYYSAREMRKLLQKHLSDKLIIDKKVIEELIDEYQNAYVIGCDIDYDIVLKDLQSLLD